MSVADSTVAAGYNHFSEPTCDRVDPLPKRIIRLRNDVSQLAVELAALEEAVSDDGAYAHCSREEFAGGLPYNENLQTFAHKLDGDCKCGTRHDPSLAPLSAKKEIEAVYVFVAEGQKDCNSLHEIGLAATTNAGGCGKWRPEYSESLRGKHVAILPDNDQPGRKHVLGWRVR